MSLLDERVDAAAREIWKADNTTLGINPPESMEAWEEETEGYLELARAALRAADAVVTEEQIAEVIATVIETHKDTIGTHWPECWKYHAACLAVLLRDMGGCCPTKERRRKEVSSATPRHNHTTRDLKMDGSCPACKATVDTWKKAKKEMKMEDEYEYEQVRGYMNLSGDFGDEVPADMVLWNMTGSEILFQLAKEMVPENRYQLLVRYAGEADDPR